METVIDTVAAYTLEAGDTIEFNGIYEIERVEDGRHGDRGLVYLYVVGEDAPFTVECYDEIDIVGWVYDD